MRCFLVVSCLIAVIDWAAARGAQTDQGFELRTTNSEGPVDRTCYDAPGIPPAIQGTYFLAGPAKFDGSPEAEWKFRGVFDGLGMVNRFEIHPEDQPTKVCYTSAWMNTMAYQAYVKDHKEPPRGVIFENTDPPRGGCLADMCDYEAPNDNNWVNMIPIGDEFAWLSDVPTMVTMDPKTMNITGHKTWADDQKGISGVPEPSWVRLGHMASGGSAHPLLIPGTHTVVELLTEMPMAFGNYYTDIYTFDASKSGPQTRTLIASIETDKPMYFHSFGLTTKHVVLPMNLINTNLGPFHEAVIMGNFHGHWKGVHVVDMMGNVQVFNDMEPFYHVHIVNTFENASGIVMDLVVFNDIPFERRAIMDISANRNKTSRDTSYPRGQVRRLHLNLQTWKTTVESLTDNQKDYDFAKIPDSKNGQPYCVYYAVEWYHDGQSYASMALMKHDICQGKKIFWSEPNVYLNEPYFIPNGQSGGEDDGTVIITANDGEKGKGIFVALDAKTMKEVERFELPGHFPFCAHGSYVPAPAKSILV